MIKFIFVMLLTIMVRTNFEGTHVQVLTAKNYDKKIDDGNMWFINHYTSWCEYCIDMEEDFAKAAAALKGIVSFGAIEVQEQNIYVYELYGVPSLRFYADGQVREYKGERDAKSITQWILKVVRYYYDIDKKTDMKVMAKLTGKTISEGWKNIKSKAEHAGEKLVDAVKEAYSKYNEKNNRKSREASRQKSRRNIEDEYKVEDYIEDNVEYDDGEEYSEEEYLERHPRREAHKVQRRVKRAGRKVARKDRSLVE